MPTLSIHTENILPILKKWLYSDKEIFVRELVSNSCDALSKLKVLREQGVAAPGDEELRIDVTLDKKARTLTFSDNGIGMTSEEVEKYIAQLAFSGAEEFLGKYKTEKEGEQIIGHFGLGFYSAYMVAENVTLHTLSYQEGVKPALWECSGSHTYTLEEGDRCTRGTEVTLFLDKDSDEFLEEGRLGDILRRYFAFIPFPIYLNGTQINGKAPLWQKPAAECTSDEYRAFYRQLYPLEEDPTFWIHLHVDYPFHLKGILYFPKITKRFEWGKSEIKLFCNRVFVSENCKDLLPDYLMVLRGALDSPDIPLNVSRSYLQMDRTVRQLAGHISKKVADKLVQLYTTQKDTFLAAWSDIEMVVKLGVLQDEKFYEKVKDVLVWENLEGEWKTLSEYQAAHQDAYQNTIFYTEKGTASSPVLELYRKQGIEVLLANHHIDTALMNFLEGKASPLKFQRLDGALSDAILDKTKEKTLLDAEGKTEATKIADFFRTHLSKEHLSIEAKSLSSPDLPAFVVFEEGLRRLRDYMAISGQPLPKEMGEKRTLILNTNSPLVYSIYGLKDKNPQLAEELAQYLFELSLLSQKELKPEQLSSFAERSSRVLMKALQSAPSS